MNSEDLTPVGNTAGATAAKQGFFTKLKNIFSFSGRISRRRYWITVIIMLPVMYILILFCAAIFSTLYTLIPLLLPAFSVWILLAAAAKRLHDTGRSAWYLLLLLLPVISLILLVFLCFRGEQNDNKYGAPTANNPNNGLIAAMIGVSMVIDVTFYAVFAVWVVSYIAISAYALSQLADAEYRPAQTPEKICSNNVKNISKAIMSYHQEYGSLPEKTGSEGFQELAARCPDLKLQYYCGSQDNQSLAYVGNGIKEPYRSSVPVIICISTKHKGSVHYADSFANFYSLKVDNHPKNFVQAIEIIYSKSMQVPDHKQDSEKYSLFFSNKDKVLENAARIDAATP